MLKAYHLQLFYIKRSGPGAWNYLNIAKMSENVFFTFFLVVLGGWGKNTSKWALGCKNAYFLKMVAPMASIINMDLINIWKKSEKNFEQNRPESSLQVVTACVGAQWIWGGSLPGLKNKKNTGRRSHKVKIICVSGYNT